MVSLATAVDENIEALELKSMQATVRCYNCNGGDASSAIERPLITQRQIGFECPGARQRLTGLGMGSGLLALDRNE